MEWMRSLPRYTVTYCQYGDNRMKPTDIWTNHPAPDFYQCATMGIPVMWQLREEARREHRG